MIAFDTFNISLVPLIEVHVVQIHGNFSSRVLDGIKLGNNGPSLWPTEPRLHVRYNARIHGDYNTFQPLQLLFKIINCNLSCTATPQRKEQLQKINEYTTQCAN